VKSAIRNYLSGGLMTKPNIPTWRLDRRISLSVLVQLMVLASLIVGSWLNLQRQLDLLQRDVTMLLQSQESVTQRLEVLSTHSISHEYRVQALEKRLGE
jgi:Tfp pilus assembly protein PilO